MAYIDMHDEDTRASAASVRQNNAETVDLFENPVDIPGIIGIVRRRFDVVLGFILLVVAITAIYTFTVTPRYTATVQLVLGKAEKNVLEQESVAAGLPTENNAVDTEVEVLKSPALAMRVIDRYKLFDDPELNKAREKSGPVSIVASLFRAAPGGSGATENMTVGASASTAEEIFARRNEILDAFQKRTAIRRVGLTYVVEVSYSSEDPEKAATIANAIADEYIDDQVGAKLAANTRANDWLAKRLIDLRKDVLADERKVAQFRAERGLTNAKGALLNEQQISELNANLIEAKADLAEKQARLERIQILVRRGDDLGTVAEVVQSPTISGLREQQAEVVRRRGELSAKYGALHPEIIKVDRELEDLETEIHNEINRIVASLRNEMEIAGERVRSLERSLTGLEAENSEDNQDLVELRQLERESQASRALYEAFLERFKETSEASLFEDADARIIARAEPPGKPSWPNKKLNLALAFAFAGVLGVGSAYMIDFLDNGLRTNGEIERVTGLPALACVPIVRAPARKRNGKSRRGKTRRNATTDLHRLFQEKPLSRFAESWRSLAAAIALFDIDNPPKVVLLTSALPGEGKTASSMCFARELARAKNRVVVVDCDFRRASMTRAVKDLRNARKEDPESEDDFSNGLVETLAGECKLADALIAPSAAPLFFLPLVRRPTTPSRLLMSDAFRKLIADLREQFDYVIIDSAPILPVADTKLLAMAADAVIFVVRWAQTPKQAVQSALRELVSSQARIAGVLINLVDTRKQQRYGYGERGYYYGQYDYNDES